MNSPGWEPGDWAVYRMQKHSTAPGPRAEDVVPSTGGDMYSYLVDKYWIVESLPDETSICLRTRKGKVRTIDVSDPRLRHPTWWERWLLAGRFRAVEEGLHKESGPGNDAAEGNHPPENARHTTET